MTTRPFLRAFLSPAVLCAAALLAALAAVLQYSLRAFVPGTLEPGAFTLENFTALAKPLYARGLGPAALLAPLAAVLQYSLRAFVPGTLEPGAFTLENFTALAKPLYARVFLDTVWICFVTAFVALIVGYPLAYALVRARR